jgi:hypothetical protein
MKKRLSARPNLLQRFLASDLSDLVMGTCLAVAMGFMINAASAAPIISSAKHGAPVTTLQSAAPVLWAVAVR